MPLQLITSALNRRRRDRQLGISVKIIETLECIECQARLQLKLLLLESRCNLIMQKSTATIASSSSTRHGHLNTTILTASRGTLPTISFRVFLLSPKARDCSASGWLQMRVLIVRTIQTQGFGEAYKVQSSFPCCKIEPNSTTAISRTSTIGARVRSAEDKAVSSHDASGRELHALVSE